jgi:anti-sigma factor RsiW
MNVTRDVIYDLLPGYFSGDLSPDTRVLVDEFLEQDPEFRKMMERFRTMFGEARGGMAPAAGRAAERVTFERARAVMHKRSELRGYTVAFGIAGLLVGFIAIDRLTMGALGVWFLALTFLVVAVYSQYQLALLKRREPGT